jgi:hypothetical protein
MTQQEILELKKYCIGAAFDLAKKQLPQNMCVSKTVNAAIDLYNFIEPKPMQGPKADIQPE